MTFIKITEQSSLYDNLENKSVREILTEMNQEDQKVALAVQKTIPEIEKLVTGIVERMKRRTPFLYRRRHKRTTWRVGRFRNSAHIRHAEHLCYRTYCRR